MKWILDRLKEKGTQSVIVGAIVYAAAYFGLDLTIESQLALAGVVATVVGLVVSFFKEKTVED